MAERDPEFTQDVLRIVYAALTDRAGLAAAMSEQQPMPVPDTAPGQPDATGRRTPSRPGPMEVGVQGGANVPVPPARPFRCGCTLHVNYEDLALSEDNEKPEQDIAQIQQYTGATREQVMQELMRRALRPLVADLLTDVTPADKPQES